MKISTLGKSNFSSIALAFVFAFGTQAVSNLAHAGGGWGDNIDITGTPIKVQTYYANSPSGMRPDPLGGPDVDTGKALRKFVDTLPSIPGLATSTNAGVNNLGNYLPAAVSEKWVNMNGQLTNDDYYEIAVVDYTEQAHSDLAKATRYRGYVQIETANTHGEHIALKYPNNSPILDATGNQVYAVHKPHYLGPVIIVNRGTAVRIKYYNYLPTGTHAGDSGELFIPVDRTLPGGGFGADGVTQFPDSRVDIHWHGGDTPWISDGTPHQWITPAGEVTAADNNVLLPDSMKRGVSAQNVPDMPAPGPGAGTLYFPNNMSGRLMFYHDHSSAITRINVYVGMAAGYLINDPVEQKLMTDGVVPSEQIPLVIQDKTFVPKDIAQQDAKWNSDHWGKEGDLWFPHVYETNQDPNSIDGTNPVGRWDWGPWFWPIFPAQYSLPSGEYGDVTTTPEAFMDTPLINGTAYPSLTVDPKAYRFRILNASNDRFFNMSLFQAMDANGAICDENNLNPAPETSGVACTEVKMVPAAGSNLSGGADPATSVSAYVNDPRAATAKHWPANVDLWPVDGRVGGVPDPATIGPDIIQIGSEGGILPAPAIIPAQPVAFEQNRRSITVLNILFNSLLMGPAERADIVVDFSNYAGSTLLLYNDAPAPVPAFDPRIDYFTGDGDQTGAGGANDTLPGYGPNTRTLMQIKVRNVAPAPAFDLARLQTELPKAYGLSQDAPVIPESVYNAAFGTKDSDNLFHISTGSINQPNFEWTPTQPGQTVLSINLIGGGTGYYFAPVVNFVGGIDLAVAGNREAKALAIVDSVTHMISGLQLIDPGVGYTSAPLITFAPVMGGIGASASVKMSATMSLPVLSKAIQELFEPVYGRMNATLGVELPFTSALIQTTIPLNYVDPATEVIADGETQIWKITHNGVDTHPVHFHLVNVQVINRIGWDGTIKIPLDNEYGWKETVRMNPLEDIIVAVRAKRPEVPFGLPKSVRPMDPSQPLGSTLGFTQIDPMTNTPLTVANAIVDYDNEYVWHCHILGHEENDFMRPFVFHPNVIVPNAPSGLTLNANVLTWTDPTPALVAATQGNARNEIGFSIRRSINGGAYAEIGTARANQVRFDGAAQNPAITLAAPAGSTYAYRVYAYNVAGTSAASNTVTLATAPLAPTNLIATVLTNQGGGANNRRIQLDWAASTNSTNQQVWRCTIVAPALTCNNFAQVGGNLTPATTTYINTGLAAGTYTYQIRAIAAGFPTATSVNVTITAGPPASPSAVLVTATAGGADPQAVVSWMDNANSEVNFQVQRKVAAAGACTANGYATVNNAAPASAPVSAIGVLNVADPTASFGATYCYQVRATNAAGSSAYVMTPNAVAMPAGVSAPLNLVATVNMATSQVNLTWTDNSTNETGFVVKVSTNGGVSFTTLNPTVTASANTGTVKTFSHTAATTPLAVAANQNYIYQVTAVNGAVSSMPVTAAVSTVVTPAVAPINLAANVTSATRLNLSWTDMAANESSYLVERATVTGGVVGAFANAVAVPAITNPIVSSAAQSAQINRAMTFNNVAVVSGTTYVFRITAQSTQFGQNASASTQITVTAGPPAAPTNTLPGFTTNATGTQVDLTWQDNANSETTYRVERATYTGAVLGAYTTLANIARSAAETSASGVLSVVSYSDTTTVAPSKYSYRITARNYAASAPLTVVADLSLPLPPAAPTAANATLLNATDVDLYWTDNSIDETGYRIEVSPNGQPFYTLALVTDTVAQSIGVGVRHYSPDFSATNVKVVAGNSYVYRITAYKTSFGYTNFSAAATTAAVNLSVPAAPTAVSAIPGAFGASVTLNWLDNATNETNYQVERAVNGGAYTVLTAPLLVANRTNYVDTTTVSGNTYAYRVTALNVSIAATFSSAPAAFAVDMTAPAAPIGLTASANAGGTQVTLSWTDVAVNETNYQVERALVTNNVVGTYGAPAVFAHALTNGAVTYIDPVATVPGSVYSYRVTALNVNGAVTIPSVSATTVVDLTPPVAPVDPTGLAYSVVNGTTVNLTWTDIATTETGYGVEVETDGVGGFVAQTPDLAANSTGYTATVAIGHTYRFQVRALTTRLGSTTYSNYSNIVSLNLAVPAVPSTLTATPAVDGTSVALSWTDLANNETGYLVEVSTNNGATYTSQTTVARNAAQSTSVNGSAVTYTHTPTVPNTKYTYRVSAVNEVVTTTLPLPIYSASITVVADLSAPGAPLAPTLLSANVTNNTTVTLGWTDNTVTPNAAGVNGYIVEVETDGVGGFVAQVPNLAAHSITATVPALVGHNYSYQVRAFNTNLGSTVYSTFVGPVSINMANPAAPVAVSATPNVSGTQVLLAWTDMANNETEYQVTTSINGVHVPALDAVVARTAVQGTNTGGAVFYSANTTPATNSSPNVYSYVVTAINQAGATVSIPSTTSITLTADLSAPAAPATPGTPIATAISATQIDVSWIPVANATGYVVQRAVNGGTYVDFATVASPAYSDPSVSTSASSVYSYKVVAATTALGATTKSATAGPAVSVNVSTPAQPAVAATPAVNGTFVDLTWAAVANATGYEVTVDGVLQPTQAVTGYHHVTTAGSGIHNYSVAAVNQAAATVKLSSVAGTASANLTPPGVPAAPVSLTASVSGTAVAPVVDLSWTAAVNATGYVLQRNIGAGYVDYATVTAGTTYSDTTPVATTNSYQVLAYTTTLGVTVRSATASPIKSVNLTVPTQPVVTATPAANGATVALTWAAVANATGYEVTADGVTTTQNVTGFTQTTVPGSGIHNYSVVAINQAGATVKLSSVAGTATANLPAAASPAAPATLTATVNGTAGGAWVTLSWTSVTNATGYYVWRSDNGGAYAVIGVPTTATYTDNSLPVGISYSYKVMTYTTTLGSTSPSLGYSPVKTANLSIPGQPAVTATPAVNGTSVDLAWAAVTNATGYEVTVDGVLQPTQAVTGYHHLTTAGSGIHNYSVVAVNQAGATVKLSSTAGTATANLAPPGAPAAPASLTASVSGSALAPSVDLSWAPVANATGYVVQRDSGAGYGDYATLTGVASVTYSDTAPAATTDSYKVFATTTVLGATVRSANASPVKSVNLTVPAQPAVTATPAANGTYVDLVWAADANATAGYAVTVDGVTTAQAGTTYHHVTTAGSGIHNYSVVAVNQAGTVKLSSTAGTATADLSAPAAPAASASLTAVVSGTEAAPVVTLDWATVPSATGYYVERSNNGGAFVTIATVTTGITATDNLAAAAPVSSYSYRVRAYTTTFGTTTDSLSASPVASVNLIQPTAPAVTNTVAVDGTAVDLTWAAVANATGYEVSVDGAPATTQPGTGYHQVSAPNAVHNFSVTAFNDVSTVKVHSAATLVTVDQNPATPTAPTVLAPSLLSTTQVLLSWWDNATNETGYQIERSVDASAYGSIADINTASSTSGTIMQNGPAILVGSTYAYRVRAYKTVLGSTSYSAWAGFAIVDAKLPADPSAVQATAPTGSPITVTWLDNANNETGYRVDRDTGAGWITVAPSLAAGTQTYVDSDAAGTLGKVVTYRVAALNGPFVSASVSAAPVDLTPAPAPTAPTVLAPSVSSSTQVLLSWWDNATTETGYLVEVSVNGGAWTTAVDYTSTTTAGTGAILQAAPSVSVGNSYDYRVSAYTTRLGSRTYSATAAFATVNLKTPAAPVASPVVVNGTDVTLSWTDNADNETSYLIEVSTDGSLYGNFKTITRTPAEAAATGGSVTWGPFAVPANGAYSYRVRAVNTNGAVTVYSAPIYLIADLTPPPATPTVLAPAPLSSTQVLLSWWDNATDETGYQIEMSTDGGANFAPLYDFNTASSASGTIMQAGPSATAPVGTTYTYRVRAYKTDAISTVYSAYATFADVVM